MSNSARVVHLLKKEQNRLTKELRGIGAALPAFGKATEDEPALESCPRPLRFGSKQLKGTLAKPRQKSVGEPAKAVPIRAKRTLSAAARKKIAAAQRARWARFRGDRKRAIQGRSHSTMDEQSASEFLRAFAKSAKRDADRMGAANGRRRRDRLESSIKR